MIKLHHRDNSVSILTGRKHGDKIRYYLGNSRRRRCKQYLTALRWIVTWLRGRADDEREM